MTIPKKRLQSSIFRFKQFVAEAPGAAMSEAIPLARLQSIVNLEVGSYRDRLYPPLTTLGLFIEQSLSADGACQDAVARYLSARHARDQAPCSLNTCPYCKARQRLPISLVEQLSATIGERLE